jgi:hypothetical protein
MIYASVVKDLETDEVTVLLYDQGHITTPIGMMSLIRWKQLEQQIQFTLDRMEAKS